MAKLGMYLGLGALIGLKLIASIPKAIANRVGIGFDDKFEIGGKEIKRPDHFTSREHKRAFETVGRYIKNALTRDAMLSFQDNCLTDPKSLWGYNEVPLPIWKEVLEFYHQQGCIKLFWELRIPNDREGKYTGVPYWTPTGERLKPVKSNMISGVVAGSREFMPSMLTEAQKQELIGAPYANFPTDSVTKDERGYSLYDEQRWTTIGEEHFRKLYYRDHSVLSEEDKQKGAETFIAIMTASQAK